MKRLALRRDHALHVNSPVGRDDQADVAGAFAGHYPQRRVRGSHVARRRQIDGGGGHVGSVVGFGRHQDAAVRRDDGLSSRRHGAQIGVALAVDQEQVLSRVGRHEPRDVHIEGQSFASYVLPARDDQAAAANHAVLVQKPHGAVGHEAQIAALGADHVVDGEVGRRGDEDVSRRAQRAARGIGGHLRRGQRHGAVERHRAGAVAVERHVVGIGQRKGLQIFFQLGLILQVDFRRGRDGADGVDGVKRHVLALHGRAQFHAHALGVDDSVLNGVEQGLPGPAVGLGVGQRVEVRAFGGFLLRDVGVDVLHGTEGPIQPLIDRVLRLLLVGQGLVELLEVAVLALDGVLEVCDVASLALVAKAIALGVGQAQGGPELRQRLFAQAALPRVGIGVLDAARRGGQSHVAALGDHRADPKVACRLLGVDVPGGGGVEAGRQAVGALHVAKLPRLHLEGGRTGTDGSGVAVQVDAPGFGAARDIAIGRGVDSNLGRRVELQRPVDHVDGRRAARAVQRHFRGPADGADLNGSRGSHAVGPHKGHMVAQQRPRGQAFHAAAGDHRRARAGTVLDRAAQRDRARGGDGDFVGVGRRDHLYADGVVGLDAVDHGGLGFGGDDPGTVGRAREVRPVVVLLPASPVSADRAAHHVVVEHHQAFALILRGVLHVHGVQGGHVIAALHGGVMQRHVRRGILSFCLVAPVEKPPNRKALAFGVLCSLGVLAARGPVVAQPLLGSIGSAGVKARRKTLLRDVGDDHLSRPAAQVHGADLEGHAVGVGRAQRA